jgi:hypothetical protein
LNGYVDHKQITRELEEMKAKGMRGALIWDVSSLINPGKIIPAGPEFLGPEFLKSIAAGSPLQLDSHLAADGRLTWSVPAGAWRILRFVRNNTGEFLNCPSPNSKGLVIDHLSRDATDAYMNHNVNSTWWNQAGPMLEDMSRACHMMQQGQFVADVCAYYGDEAPNLVPARRIAPTVQSQWSDDKCAHCRRPKPERKEPYRIDIAALVKVGDNPIEITVVNTWNNRIVGDLHGKPEDRITHTNIAGKFNANSPLLPSGLLGPVMLKFPLTASCGSSQVSRANLPWLF